MLMLLTIINLFVYMSVSARNKNRNLIPSTCHRNMRPLTLMDLHLTIRTLTGYSNTPPRMYKQAWIYFICHENNVWLSLVQTLRMRLVPLKKINCHTNITKKKKNKQTLSPILKEICLFSEFSSAKI